ncbi:mitogen-activated protein kinase kinase kinase 9 [Phytophthora boehmeriae]|uniref:Mitogen-activated protein kinase kinase kinase 9 n=1 Tax=Phytophthora boehmeriae TaxID=109152 RepID=A0A8T1VM73_9STRA|nr:mitogen-activated protein kinase kinase kinase 9 [Phytophthora boehmeriae]
MGDSISIQSDVGTLQAAHLAPRPHQRMYLSVYERALRVGALLEELIRSKPRRKGTTFRRRSSKKEKKPKSKLLSIKKAHSEVPETEICDLQQDQMSVEFSLEMATFNFHLAVAGLETFVATFAKTDRFVFHLASMRRMFLDLKALGIKLDRVLNYAQLKETVKVDPQWTNGEWTWQKQLQADRDAEEAELSAKAAKNALPFARNMMPHEPMEALTLLKFEIDFFKAENSTKHVNSMKKVFFSVVRSSNGRVAKIPEWYIPPYALSYSREKGIEGSVGTSYHGVWVDRKPSEGLKSEEGQITVAHKVVVKRMYIHADAIEFFRKEVELWFNLKHDNILKLYGASHCSRPAILVSEEATNGSLVNYVHHHQLKGKDMWNLFLQAAQGLKYLHDNRLVHGNLKSSNILVSGDGQVKLADFGLGILALQNQMVQDEVVEERRRREDEKRSHLGLTKKRAVQEVKKLEDMGWRAPTCRKKKQFGRPTIQDDVYSFGLCLLDLLLPKLSSIICEKNCEENSRALKYVGDEAFEPLSGEVTAMIVSDEQRKLITGMCQEKPSERIALAEVITRMEALRDTATVDAKECCIQ